jgi:hypothetical protein
MIHWHPNLSDFIIWSSLRCLYICKVWSVLIEAVGRFRVNGRRHIYYDATDDPMFIDDVLMSSKIDTIQIATSFLQSTSKILIGPLSHLLVFDSSSQSSCSFILPFNRLYIIFAGSLDKTPCPWVVYCSVFEVASRQLRQADLFTEATSALEMMRSALCSMISTDRAGLNHIDIPATMKHTDLYLSLFSLFRTLSYHK